MDYEEKLKKYILDNGIDGEHLSFDVSCHSVSDAAVAANVNEDDFVKNICMFNENDELIVSIVKGEHRASTKRVKKALGCESVRLAKPEEILERIGYPCGGTPSFGYEAKFLIDPKVIEKEVVYTGGGSDKSLVRIKSEELQKSNNGLVVRVRK